MKPFDPSDRGPSTVAPRFAAMEAISPFKRIDSEVIPVSQLPIFVRLGEHATTLAVVNQHSHLTLTERGFGNPRHLDNELGTLIIVPADYDIGKSIGFVGLREGQTVNVGRSDENLPARFKPFSTSVSNQHASLSMSRDGERILIKDLDSTNGTYVSASNKLSGTRTIFHTLEPEASNSPESPILRGAFGSSVASEDHPLRNEDSFLIDEKHLTYGAFDGVSGRAGGSLSSNAAKEFVAQKAEITTFQNLDKAGDYLRKLLVGSHNTIVNQHRGSLTTAVLAKVHRVDTQLYASIAHVGDSRAYLMRAGVLKALTTDHTHYRKVAGVTGAMAQQELLANTDTISILSDQDAVAFRRRNVIAACLGDTETAIQTEIDIKHFAITSGDVLILTTDGVHDNLTTKEMQNLLVSTTGKYRADALVQTANNRAKGNHFRAKMDDVTAVVINI